LRIRIKNIPLSEDNGVISRVLTLRGIEVIAINRDKLRVNGKLTNCDTGDRLVVVKTLRTPYFMVFGMFTARVWHAGQTTGDRIKCSNCLQSGHKFSQCVHDWFVGNVTHLDIKNPTALFKTKMIRKSQSLTQRRSKLPVQRYTNRPNPLTPSK